MVVVRCLANWEVRQNTIHKRWLSLPIPSINSGDPKTPSGSVIRQTGRIHRIHWQLLYLWLQSATEKGYRLKSVKGISTGVESGRSTCWSTNMAYRQPRSLSEAGSFIGALLHITIWLIYLLCPECNSILSHIFILPILAQGLQEDSCQRWCFRDYLTEEEDKCQTSFGAHKFSSVQPLSRVQLFATPWTAAQQASLIITNSRSLHKLMSIESVMPSNHLSLSSPSPPALSLSQHQRLFQWVCSLWDT